MARVTLSQPGEDVFVGGADIEVFGTNSGGEIITVITGSIRLDPSFNRGGDTIVLPGLATSYSAYRIGAEVILTRSDGAVTVRVPFGTAGLEVQFDGGDSRTLLFDTSAGQVTIEGQAVSNSSASPTILSAAGAVPSVSYDVVGANIATTEGDSGTKLLTFTISLDRAVTGEPLTLNYQTQNGTATAGSDFVAASGTVTIPVGQQSATVAVTITGDTVPEGNETFTLNLTSSLLRNGPETLTGTITNDDFSGSLTTSADTRQGSAGNDNFTALNTALGAGDQITDATTTDSDTLALTVTGATTNRNFAGFTLTNVENVAVTNTSGQPVVLDLSGSTGVKSVTSINSSASVVFGQLTSNASLGVSNVSGTATDVQAIYQPGVTAGTSTVASVAVISSTVNQIILGTAGAGNTGLETVNVSVTGVSSINAIATELTTLNINGGGDVTIVEALASSVRTVNASSAGRVSVNFSNNDVGTGVTFTGSNGNDSVISGSANDTINTGLGDDLVDDEGGNDLINTGGGNDNVILRGAGDVTIDTGIGNDSVSFAAGTFDGNDTVAFGDGADTLVIAESSVESDYVGISGADTLTVTAQGTTNLGSDGNNGAAGEAAGIRTVNLNVAAAGGLGNDTLTATDYVGGLTVNLGAALGTDTVLLGAGDDVINTASLDNSDVLAGNGGSDTLNVTDGSAFLSTVLQFGGFETINLISDGDGEDAFIVLDDSNAPTGNGTLAINAGSFTVDEEVQFFGNTVTAYSVNVISGAAADVIDTRNTRADTVSAGLGDDTVFASGGDTVNAGGGADSIVLEGGANVVLAGDGNDTVFIDLGVGNNTISGEAGDDTFFVVNSADLTAGDVIDGGTNIAIGDTISVEGTFTDAQFTGLRNVEILTARDQAVSNITLGTEAEASGIRTVNLTGPGADVLDASSYSATANLTIRSGGGSDTILAGADADVLFGGLGGDTLTGGAGADRFAYVSRDESRVFPGGVDNRDVITDFISGTDKIDLRGLTDPANVVGDTIRFNGNWQTFGEGQGAVNGTGGDGSLDVVFIRDANTLWIDTNDDGQLDGEDMQIILTGVQNISAADVYANSLVSAPPVVSASVEDFAVFRTIENMQFA